MTPAQMLARVDALSRSFGHTSTCPNLSDITALKFVLETRAALLAELKKIEKRAESLCREAEAEGHGWEAEEGEQILLGARAAITKAVGL